MYTMASKLSYRDIGHPTYQDSIKGHNQTTLKLVKTVAEFAQKVSLAHEQFANQVLNVVETFKKKNTELRKDRPLECPSSLTMAWETLLQETQYDAQAHADTATLLMKNVYTPLLEISSYKKSQSKKLYSFRESFEGILSKAEESVFKCHQAYVEAYQRYKDNSSGRDSVRYLAEYHNAHNAYILQIRSSNRTEEEYHNVAFPYLLEELEDIHIDLANTLNGAIESHALLLLTKANEESRRFEGILKICKQVNPKLDVHNFVMSVSQEPLLYEPKLYIFNPPADPNIPGSELNTLKDQIVIDRHTESNIKGRRGDLQKEASELTTYLKQNQDVTQTLMNVCQRNLANHLYSKVYETQEDLCRKRNEIRLANLQLAAVRAQIELLSPKQNGSTVDSSSHDSASKAHNKASIKGMWKKAFKSLKTDSKGSTKDKEEKLDRQESKYSRMSRQSSLKHLLRRSDSGDSQPPPPREPRHFAGSHSYHEESQTFDKSSRQSSLKRLMRKDSKEKEPASTPSDSELGPCFEEREQKIDPVYSLLKCAADLPRQNKPGPQGHACCMRSQELNAVRNSSRSSSPSSDDAKSSGCSCPCHTPEVLANYHDSLIQSNKKKHRGRKT